MAPPFSSTSRLLSFSPVLPSNHKEIIRRRLCPPALKITVSYSSAQRQSYWSTLDATINTHLLNSLPTTPPPSVTDPMRHLISAAPKTIAPALCLAACELVGGQPTHAINTACALLLMHAASYSHSQHPALLGRKTINPNPTRYGDGVELLTADGILPLGYEMVTRSDGSVDSGRILRVIVEIAEAMGSLGMVEGQLREAEGGGDERKEGRMWACGAACGGILGGGSEEEVERLRKFGLYAGMAHAGFDGAGGFRSLAESELDGFGEEGKEVAAVRLLLLD